MLMRLTKRGTCDTTSERDVHKLTRSVVKAPAHLFLPGTVFKLPTSEYFSYRIIHVVLIVFWVYFCSFFLLIVM